jgi:hypothetical protein
MVERVPVRFEGEGAGIGELSWGQRELWRVIREQRTWLPIGSVQPLPAGVTLADAVADLEYVMSRYPSMRTRLVLEPGRPRQTRQPRQQVARTGEIGLEIVDADPDADPAKIAEQVFQGYRQRDYDFVSEWPVRMAVVRHRGVLTHRVWVMCHLVTDGAGSRVLLSDLADRTTAAIAAPPLEQARWQGSPAGQRHCATVLRHWEKVLHRVPARRFGDHTPQPGPRYWHCKSSSPATYLGVRAISARTGVEGPSVVLAIFAVALAQVTGVSPVVARVVASNRFRPGLARTVSPILQTGLWVVDVSNTTVDSVVSRARGGAIATYKYSYCDPIRREELISRIGLERGEPIELGCVFNDRRLSQFGNEPRPAGESPALAEIHAARSHHTFWWVEGQDYQPFDPLIVNVDDKPDTVALTIGTDTQHISRADVESCVRGMEEVAVEAAADPETSTRVGRLG